MVQYCRALFISDVHLGTRAAQAQELLDFLRQVQADTIYLVGDIIDFWRIQRGLIWPPSHSNVLQELLERARQGTRVVFIPGNHDAGLRRYCGKRFGSIEIEHSTVHETVDGRRYLVMHGDDYDVVVQRAHWLAVLGERGYSAALAINRPFNWMRARLGFDYWSLSAFLKERVKGCVNRASRFEQALAEAASRHNAAGIICGHIHKAASHRFGDVHYLNTGDWVESCTAVIEQSDGKLEIVHWPAHAQQPAGCEKQEPLYEDAA